MLFDRVANHEHIPIILIGTRRQFLGYRVLVNHFKNLSLSKNAPILFSSEKTPQHIYKRPVFIVPCKRQAQDLWHFS